MTMHVVSGVVPVLQVVESSILVRITRRHYQHFKRIKSGNMHPVTQQFRIINTIYLSYEIYKL